MELTKIYFSPKYPGKHWDKSFSYCLYIQQQTETEYIGELDEEPRGIRTELISYVGGIIALPVDALEIDQRLSALDYLVAEIDFKKIRLIKRGSNRNSLRYPLKP